VPDVPSSDSRANNAELSQHRQRSLVSIPSVAGQPPSAGSDGNQDGALCAFIPSVCRAAHRDLTPRMPGPHVILDHDRPGGEATRLPTLLQWTPNARRTRRAHAGNGRQRRSLTSKSQLLSMAEALSRLIPNADCRVILVIRHRQVEKWHFSAAGWLRVSGPLD
jgi:hypothetical protein